MHNCQKIAKIPVDNSIAFKKPLHTTEYYRKKKIYYT